MEYEISPNKKLILKQGDITEMKVDAIVNAANEHLQHGGGVAAAIARKGGKVIWEESEKIGYVPTGSAAVTSAGNLPCKYVIHAVGPIWRGGKNNEASLLASAIKKSLLEATKLNLKSIAFPAISTGIFGYPVKEAAEVMLSTAINYLKSTGTPLEEVYFVLYDNKTFQIFQEVLKELIEGGKANDG